MSSSSIANVCGQFLMSVIDCGKKLFLCLSVLANRSAVTAKERGEKLEEVVLRVRGVFRGVQVLDSGPGCTDDCFCSWLVCACPVWWLLQARLKEVQRTDTCGKLNVLNRSRKYTLC